MKLSVVLCALLFMGFPLSEYAQTVQSVKSSPHSNPMMGFYQKPDPKNIKHPDLTEYFSPVSSSVMTPDENGFIRRWLLLEPFTKSNRSNVVFIDSYLKENLSQSNYPEVWGYLPHDGQKVKAKTNKGMEIVRWHAFDSNLFNVKLFRFASGLNKNKYGVVFWGITVINAPEEMHNVRLAAGSNGASCWWLNNSEVLILSGDRRMVMDDGISPRVTLEKGRNILRFAVINGPGMSDICVRFLDSKGEPIKNLTITTK
ncbi:acetylxylan esterase [Segatella asaccharophila]